MVKRELYRKVQVVMKNVGGYSGRVSSWPNSGLDLTLIVAVVDNSGSEQKMWRLFLVGGGELDVTVNRDTRLTFSQFLSDIEAEKSKMGILS